VIVQAGDVFFDAYTPPALQIFAAGAAPLSARQKLAPAVR
jgi:hypothetical protein